MQAEQKSGHEKSQEDKKWFQKQGILPKNNFWPTLGSFCAASKIVVTSEIPAHEEFSNTPEVRNNHPKSGKTSKSIFQERTKKTIIVAL